jgi:hypothetical protein
VLLNKRLTKFVFRSSIQSQERDRDVQGLWRSLNFVKLSEIKREISRSRLSLTVNSRIVGDLVERLATDQEFARRQRMLGEPRPHRHAHRASGADLQQGAGKFPALSDA